MPSVNVRDHAIISALAVLIAGCGEDSIRKGAFDEVAPILSAECNHCHQPGGGAPFSLVTFEQASSNVEAISAAVASGKMPPWNASTEDCETPVGFVRNETVTADERRILEQWSRSGAPRGTLTGAPAKTLARLRQWDIAFSFGKDYRPSSAEDFRCFVFDPELKRDRFITALDFVPGDPASAHHASLFVDPERVMADKLGPNGFDCSGSLGSLPELLPWTPGMGAIVHEPNVSQRLPARSLLVVQIHYAHATQASEGVFHIQTTNKPRVREIRDLVFGGALAAGEPGTTRLLPGPNDRAGKVEFYLPIGVSDHSETMEIPVGPNIGQLAAIQAHAHQAATDIRADLIKADGRKICLLRDRWRFDWQRRYTYDPSSANPIRLESGDIVRVRCTYDNSPANTKLAEFRRDSKLAIAPISYGIQSHDEMCHVMAHVVSP
jgi:hypothetical protein